MGTWDNITIRENWNDTEYKRYGTMFRQVYRTKGAVIFKEDNKEHYEIHINKKENFLATNSSWGIKGFTCKSLDRAMKKIEDKLGTTIKEEPIIENTFTEDDFNFDL